MGLSPSDRIALAAEHKGVVMEYRVGELERALGDASIACAEAQREVQRLTSRVFELEQTVADQVAVIENLESARGELGYDVELLREALQKFGEHDESCTITEDKCTCGYSAAMDDDTKRYERRRGN